MLTRDEWKVQAQTLWASPLHRGMYNEWLGVTEEMLENVPQAYYSDMFKVWSAMYLGENGARR